METLEVSRNFAMENKMVQYLHPTPQGSGVSDLRSSSNTTQLQNPWLKLQKKIAKRKELRENLQYWLQVDIFLWSQN